MFFRQLAPQTTRFALFEGSRSYTPSHHRGPSNVIRKVVLHLETGEVSPGVPGIPIRGLSYYGDGLWQLWNAEPLSCHLGPYRHTNAQTGRIFSTPKPEFGPKGPTLSRFPVGFPGPIAATALPAPWLVLTALAASKRADSTPRFGYWTRSPGTG